MMVGNSAGWALVMVLHLLFCLALLFAVVSGVVWLARFASKQELKKWFLVSSLVGVLGVLLTGLFVSNGMMDWDDRRWNEDDRDSNNEDGYEDMRDRMDDMMDWESDDEEKSDEATTEETDTTDTTTETPAQ